MQFYGNVLWTLEVNAILPWKIGKTGNRQYIRKAHSIPFCAIFPYLLLSTILNETWASLLVPRVCKRKYEGEEKEINLFVLENM